MNWTRQVNVWYAILAVLAFLFFQQLWIASRHMTALPYSEFLTQLKEGNVQALIIRGDYIEGRLKTPTTGGREVFITTRVDPALAQQLQPFDVPYEAVADTGFLSGLMSWLLPALLFFALWSFVVKRAMDKGGASFLSIGKSRARVYVETDTKVTFKDIAGVDEAKEELQEIIRFLMDPKQYGRLGAHIPKGVLLVGPPGTGKTLLARAVAGEAGVPFFSISGAEFVEMFVGVGAARVRDLFEQARSRAPAIIFIDELDALGRARGSYGLGGHDEKEQTLNQLLAEMDGFDTSSGLVMLAATNRPEILDPALLRSGRFDRQILVDRPDKLGRLAILNVHLRKIVLASDVMAEKVAALTPGFSGADLATLVNEAALVATRRAASAVAMQDFTLGIERIVAGLEKKSRVLSIDERRIIAYHEIGHALVAMALPGADPVQKVSIVPHGIHALGYTMQRPMQDRYVVTQPELQDKLAVLLGGRAAEQLVFGGVSTGAADDLQKVAGIARSMVTRYAMEPGLGHLALDEEPVSLLDITPHREQAPQYSQATAQEIDLAVRKFVDAAYDHASAILGSARDVLEQGAQQLLERETLDEEALRGLGRALRSRLKH